MATNNRTKIRIGEKNVYLDEVTCHEIVTGQGPSNAALVTAFLCAYPDAISGRPAIWVTFGLKSDEPAPCRVFAWIYGMRHESGNDEPWIIDGVLSFSRSGPKHEFGGYYNTRTREGSLRICNFIV